MAATIQFPGREHQLSSSLSRLFPYCVGSFLGAVALGLTLALLGHLAFAVQPALSALWLVGISLLSARMPMTSVSWPESRRQIPRMWVQPPSWPGLFLAGTVLGAGVFTYIRYSVFYVVLMITFVVGSQSILLGTVPLGVYGLTNGVMPLLSGKGFASNASLSTERLHGMLVVTGRVLCLLISGNIALSLVAA